jgi:hypothetical protein
MLRNISTPQIVQKNSRPGSMQRNGIAPLVDGINEDFARALLCWLGYEILEPIIETAKYVFKRIEGNELKEPDHIIEAIQKKISGFIWKSLEQKNATMACLACRESFQ